MNDRAFRTMLAALAGCMMAASAAAAAPKRVVSMNACTDQMAILVADEGQLHSVSYLASDPGTSALSSLAGRYRPNHGLAEEVFLMQPDLVVTGTYSTRATVALLRRLGIRVEEFEPENSFDDVRANLARMGDLLGRREKADEIIAALDRDLAELEKGRRPDVSVATYYANSFTSGAGTLVDEVIVASGLTNIAATLGLTGTARLPLELLVLAKPDLLVDDETGNAPPALATENFVHPAYTALARNAATAVVPASYTLCGTPFTVEAARLIQKGARALVEPGSK